MSNEERVRGVYEAYGEKKGKNKYIFNNQRS
jgi:hypothetical protein